MNKALEQIKQFHGHLGPYVVIGYKMGEIANQLLGNKPFEKQAIVRTGITPPISCMIDGIQISSGCTMGTGALEVHDEGIAKAQFTNSSGKLVEIMLKTSVQQMIDTQVTEDNMHAFAEQLYEKPNDELFDIIEKSV